MKKLLLPLTACFATLLPLAPLQAASPADVKLYGGFAPGKEFTFKVTNVTCAKGTLTGGTVKASVPSGIPKFRKGQNVTFKIGSKGQLTGPGFSTSYLSGGAVSNAYADAQSGMTLPDTAIVFKSSKTKPNGVNLTFLKVTGSGLSTATYLVNYTLE